MARATAGQGGRIVLTLWLSLVLLAAGTSLARNAGNAVVTTKVFTAVTAPLAAAIYLAMRFRARRIVAVALVGMAYLYLGGASIFLYTVARCPDSPNTSRVCSSALSDE